MLPYQAINNMLREGEITVAAELLPGQVQPASIDLRLGPVAYQVAASFLPGKGVTVPQRIQDLFIAEIDLREGAVLEKGGVYVIPLLESLAMKTSASPPLPTPKAPPGDSISSRA